VPLFNSPPAQNRTIPSNQSPNTPGVGRNMYRVMCDEDGLVCTQSNVAPAKKTPYYFPRGTASCIDRPLITGHDLAASRDRSPATGGGNSRLAFKRAGRRRARRAN